MRYAVDSYRERWSRVRTEIFIWATVVSNYFRSHKMGSSSVRCVVLRLFSRAVNSDYLGWAQNFDCRSLWGCCRVDCPAFQSCRWPFRLIAWVLTWAHLVHRASFLSACHLKFWFCSLWCPQTRKETNTCRELHYPSCWYSESQLFCRWCRGWSRYTAPATPSR